MAELVEAFGYSGTLQRLFLNAQVIIILITIIHSSSMSTWSQCPSHSRRGAHRAPGRHLDSTQRNKRLHSPLPEATKNNVYYKVTFSISPLYKVSDAGGCLAESVLQERVQKGSTRLMDVPSAGRQKDWQRPSIHLGLTHTYRKGLLPRCVLSQCDFCISKA